MGLHLNQELQQDLKIKGEKNFAIEIVDRLPYDEKEDKEDYTEELQILKLIWEEKLIKERWELYKKYVKNDFISQEVC